MPAAIIKRIEDCVVDYFLFAKGAPPFQMMGFYATGRPLFQPGFPETFARAYEKTEVLKHYDVYSCRKPPSVAPSAAPSPSGSTSAGATP